MTRLSSRWVLKPGVFLVAVALALAPLSSALAEGPSDTHALQMRVETIDSGFKCVPADAAWCTVEENGELIVEAEQGQMVELTFAWAHVGYVQEEHVMVLDGYKLETDSLTFANREATMKFIADKAGRFEFKCDLQCEVHDYLHGYLKVGRGGGSAGFAGAAFTPTTLTVQPSSLVTVGDPVTFMFELRDAVGKPVPKSELELFLDAGFVGTKGKMQLATIKTDPNGVAFFEYTPRLDAEKHSITARYEGGGVYSESESSVVIEQIGAPVPGYETEPIGLEGLRALAPRVFAGIAIAVWLTLTVVLLRAVSVRWVREKSEVPRG